MNKLILIFIFLLLCSAIQAHAFSNAVKSVLSTTYTAGASCSAASNEVGNRTQGSSAIYFSPDYIGGFRAQADCSGNLNTGFLYSDGDTSASAKICIYTSSDTTPQSGDALVGCTGTMNALTAGWKSSAISGTHAVTSGNYYWVMSMASTDTWNTRGDTTVTLYYKACSGCIDSPPATLGTGWETLASYSPFSSYVTIGD